jgi:hypothetical protein
MGHDGMGGRIRRGEEDVMGSDEMMADRLALRRVAFAGAGVMAVPLVMRSGRCGGMCVATLRGESSSVVSDTDACKRQREQEFTRAAYALPINLPILPILPIFLHQYPDP